MYFFTSLVGDFIYKGDYVHIIACPSEFYVNVVIQVPEYLSCLSF